MRIPYKLGEQAISLPSAWEDITTGQMMEIKTLDRSDFFKLLAILSGVDRKNWFDCELSMMDLELLTETLAFIKETPDLKAWPMPSAIEFGGKSLQIPEDLNLKTFGQSTVFSLTIFDSVARTGDVVEVMDQALAIYLQPLFTGEKFDADNLSPFVKMARETKVAEAYPVASFFISKFLQSTTEKPQPSSPSQSNTAKPRNKPESKASKITA